MTIYTSGTQAIQGRTVNYDPEPWPSRTTLTKLTALIND